MATVHFKSRSADRPRRARAPAVAAVLAVALGVVAVRLGPGWYQQVATRWSDPVADPTASAEHWAAANLPVDARIVADRSVAAVLSATGTPAWDLLDFRQLDAPRSPALASNWKTYDYLVSTPALRSHLSPAGQTRKALASSVVVASFGVGAGRVEVDEVEAAGRSGPAQQQAALRAQSTAAGRQLLTSASVRLSPQAAQQAVSGQVDGRLLALLVGLGSQHSLTVGEFTDPDPGGLFPNRLRQATVLVVDGALVRARSSEVTAALTWLAAQSGEFRPSAVAVRGSQLLIRFRVVGPREPGAL
jgi:hypothetical protein